MARKCGRRIYKSIGVMLLFVLSFICSVWGLANFPVEVRAAGLLKDNIGKTLNIQTLNGTRWSASTWRKDSSGNYTEYLGHGDDNYFFRAENSDEPLYCVQMRNPFVFGTNTVKNMSDLMDENTIKSVSAGLYYFDQNANGLSPKQKEQGKQCIIWTFTEYLLKGGEKAIKSNDPDSGSVNAVLEKVYRAYNAGELQPTIKDITASGAVGVPRQTSNQAVGAFYYDYNPVGSIEIIKSDSVLGKTGWMSQDGLSAEFNIINRSGKNISYHGKSISDGAVLAAVKTMLKNNQYSVLITDVPYGTYEIVETKPGTGYVSSGKSVIVNVKTKGDTVNVDVANKFIRGDMKFQKTGGDGALLSVPFVVTNTETGESHIIVTNKGSFNSAEYDGESVNGNDSLIEKEKITEEDYDYNSGVWFSKGANGEYAYNASSGSFPYGTYTLEELRCDNNVGYALEKAEFTISEDNTVLDLGTITDKNIVFKTFAYDINTGNSTGVVGNTSITDKISYTNLTAGEEYTLVGEIMDKSTGEKLNIEGSSAEKTFTPESSDGMVEMLYNIDSTDVAGREIVVFEDLFLDGKLIATHRDLNDENQTVSFPAISTKAGNHNGEKTVAHGENITIIDRVSYFNLESGKEYSLRGSIINKNTGEMLDTSAHEKFIAEENGEVHVHFSASTHGLSDQEIVIFEELTDENGVTLIEHSDINNKDQTLKVLKEEKSIPVKPVETGDSIQGLRLWHIMAITSIAGISLTVIIRKVMR